MSVTGIMIILLLAIIGLILTTSVLKIHPFLALVIVTLFAGFAFGLDSGKLLRTMADGFGGILSYIGLVIVLGSVLGEMLEQSGAAESIAQGLLRGPGKRNPQLALSVLGATVGIPVFCDTGFIILSKLTKSIAQSSKLPAKKLSVGLAAGLYTTHTLVPPTPGPIAAAGNLGGSDFLGLIMIVGLLLSVPVILGTYFFVKSLKLPQQLTDSYPDELPVHGSLSTLNSLIPIMLPIGLIGMGTFLKLSQIEFPGVHIFLFLGQPVIALLLSVICGYFVLKIASREVFTSLVSKGVQSAGPILIITGAGGAFGSVLKASGLAESLELFFLNTQVTGATWLIVAFAIAATLKTAQGSSTSAIVITSSLLSPFLAVAGLESPMDVTLVVMAIGGGAMTFSHANDSFFWVVSQFGELTLKEAYKTYSLTTLLQGLITLALVLLIAVLT